jgi:hypothetical protein
MDNASFFKKTPKAKGTHKMPLVPRTPIMDVADNNKAKNKRTGSTKPKPRPKTLMLQPQVKQADFEKKKVAEPRKAYKGRSKRTEEPRDVFRHPSSVGVPLEPKSSGGKGETTKQLGTQKMIKPVHEPFRQEQEVVYEPKKVPRYASSRETFDDEGLDFNFKKGIPVHKSDEPSTTLHSPQGRLPDEFHNIQFER